MTNVADQTVEMRTMMGTQCSQWTSEFPQIRYGIDDPSHFSLVTKSFTNWYLFSVKTSGKLYLEIGEAFGLNLKNTGNF